METPPESPQEPTAPEYPQVDTSALPSGSASLPLDVPAPVPAPAPPVKPRLFRVSMFPVALCVFLGGTPVLLLTFLSQNAWTAEAAKLFIALLIAGVPISLVTAWVLYEFYPVGVSSQGILGCSFWGFAQSVAWDDMKDVKTFRILNLRWIRIFSKSTPAVTWVSLFLADYDAFEQEVKAVKPEDNFLLYHLYKLGA